MSLSWKQQLGRMAEAFLDEHWEEDWPDDDWDKDVKEFTEQAEGGLYDRWIEFRDQKNADRTAAVMDARPR